MSTFEKYSDYCFFLPPVRASKVQLMFPLVDSSDNGSDVSFDRSRTVPCEEWSYNESSSGSSAVPEVRSSRGVFRLRVLRCTFSVLERGNKCTLLRAVAEILDPRYRTFLNLGYTAGFAIPTLLLPGVAYVLGNWKLLQLVSALSVLACLPFMLFCDNLSCSPSFGLCRHQGQQLRQLRRLNGRGDTRGICGPRVVYYCRRRPSQVAALLPRRNRQQSQLNSPTALLAAAGDVSSIPYLSLSMSMAGRFFLVLSGSVKWVWTTELFPTAARGFGFAACFTVGRIGGILAPFISHLNKHAPLAVSSALLALAGIAGAVTAAMLPETRGVELPDTFLEAESIALKRTK
ncbi:hypothetical protein HPB48_017037 [Haemaphysalis longicornis]|uniref:Uncharacterized protein n=1 Tax=Haemaphysalis longicornis TaxID=44386 RepID=A0A9J6FLJ3_HAELO|nr:hypothetical protein HPB48_017037 [Haemaphysalis longicornis]